MRLLSLFLVLTLAFGGWAQEEGGTGGTDGPAAGPSEGTPPAEPTGDQPATTEEPPIEVGPEPLIADPPKRLDQTKSSAKGKKSNKKKRKSSSKNASSGTTKTGKASGKSASQGGVVQTDGAAVYKVPNFDAPVLDYLKGGQKLRISTKVYKGIGGFGAFYKVKVSSKAYGYVADVDVVPEFKAQSAGGKGKPGSSEKNPDFNRNPRDPPEEQLPIFFTRYIGGAFGMVNFTEKFSGRQFNSNDWMVGLRLAGPGTIVEGLPFDVSVLFHQGAPSYYTDIAGKPPSGFYLLGDFFLPYPFFQTEDSLVCWGLGMMATYTKFTLQIKNTIFDSQEIRAGLALQGSYSLRLDNYLVRLEAKYYYEKTAYLGYFVTLMRRY